MYPQLEDISLCQTYFCSLRIMDAPVTNEFVVLMPTLLLGVVACDGIPCTSWNTKCVTFTNEAGIEDAKGICHGVDANLVIHMNGKPFGDD